MWLKKLKRKKLQFLLLTLILISIAAIFSGCISFALGINEFKENYYADERCPEFFFASEGTQGVQSLQDFQKENSSMEELYLQKGKISNDNIRVNGTSISLIQNDFFALEDADSVPFDFRPNGDIKNLKTPKEGTVWISAVLADTKNIQTGDKIQIKGTKQKTHTFTVAGTYNAAICPAATMAFYPFYINASDLEMLSDMQDGYFGCFSRNTREKPLSDYIETLPKEFTSSMQVQYDIDGLRMSLEMTTLIIAGIGVGAAFIIFIVSLVIMRFILKSNLVKEYRSIGIYKAMGFQVREIIGFYLKSYLFTGTVGIVIGAILGLPIGQYLIVLSTKYVGSYTMKGTIFFYVFLSAILLIALLAVNTFLALIKIRKMNPVQALSMEMASTKTKVKKSLIPNASSSFSTAVNDIVKRKGTSFMVILVLTVAFYLSIFFSMVDYTSMNMSNNSAAWFAIPNTGCFVNGDMNADIEKKITESPYVEQASMGQFYMLIDIEAVDQKNDLTNCSIFSYSDFSADATGIRYREGRGPKGEKEIAVSTLARHNLNTDVGEYIKLKINGVTGDYLIVGQYDSMMNGGMSMQIPNQVLDACNIEYKNNLGFIKLKDQADFQSFKTEIEATFKDHTVTDELGSIKDATEGVADIIIPISTILVVIFIGFSFLNIINLLLMNNINNRKKFGVLKSLGFTNGYIMRQNIIRILLLSGISIIIALAIHFSASAKIFRAMATVDAFQTSIPVLIGLLTGMLGLIVFTSLMFTIPLRKITPTELMEE